MGVCLDRNLGIVFTELTMSISLESNRICLYFTFACIGDDVYTYYI